MGKGWVTFGCNLTAKELNANKLRLAARNYGKVATRKFFDQVLADAT